MGDKGEETVYKRRRAAQSAKLHKGVKAKTSSKPGETQSIDFYQLSAQIIEGSSDGDDDEKENDNKSNVSVQRKKKISLLLVDAPGYGFAYGPKKERNNIFGGNVYDEGNSPEMEFLFPWQSLIETYIIDLPRSSLKRVLLLIDARHGMKQADINFLASLQSALMLRQKQYRNDEIDGGKNNNIRSYARDINKDKRRKELASIDSTLNEKQSSTARLPPVPTELPPLQIVLTKCDLVSQSDLARRVVQVRKQLSDSLIRQPKILPEMLVSAQMEGQLGVIELQKELASLCGDRWT